MSMTGHANSASLLETMFPPKATESLSTHHERQYDERNGVSGWYSVVRVNMRVYTVVALTDLVSGQVKSHVEKAFCAKKSSMMMSATSMMT